jgi:4-aminobutyrate aminotransferase
LARSLRLGSAALERLKATKAHHPLVADVRGIGMLLAVELAVSSAPARDEAERVMYACLSRGLAFKVGQGNVLTLSPALVIGESDLARALEIVDGAIGDVEEGRA